MAALSSTPVACRGKATGAEAGSPERSTFAGLEECYISPYFTCFDHIKS